jgi:hypothetical protein
MFPYHDAEGGLRVELAAKEDAAVVHSRPGEVHGGAVDRGGSATVRTHDGQLIRSHAPSQISLT